MPEAAPASDAVIGVDAGGTASTAVLATSDGSRVASATGLGLNPRSSRTSPAEALTAVLRHLVDAAPEVAARVRTGVLGVAGADTAGHARVDQAAVTAWRAAGLAGRPRVVPDIAIAHAAGSPSQHGVVLIAGTGAVAAAIRDDAVDRRADGLGWLLGDTGSGVWLGVRAARAALAALDGREPTTPLAVDVLVELGALTSGSPLPSAAADRAALAQRVIATVDAMRPAELGRLAPLVSRAAESGDPVAARITAAAVRGLLQTLATVYDGADAVGADTNRGTVVLAGSVLLQPGPISSGVRRAILDRGETDVRDAGDGAGGAAAIALRQAGHPVTDEMHARLTRR